MDKKVYRVLGGIYDENHYCLFLNRRDANGREYLSLLKQSTFTLF
nr:MAG TPA: hypothetical protein [Caudoviricetes sp.]